MDFFYIEEIVKKEIIEIRPVFEVCVSSDLMIRGGAFYAVWDEELGLWNEDEYAVGRIVDNELWKKYEELSERFGSSKVRLFTMKNFSSGSWEKYKRFIAKSPNNYKPLNSKLTFADTITAKTDYASKRLPYKLSEGDCPCWDELISTLYDPLERQKIEWAIGAVISGDAINIQKFLVFYGDAGTGKSTVLNIIQKLFVGYYCTFDSKALGNSSNQFSLEPFKDNPLVGIQHDGDLSRIDDNSRLNSIVAHEEIIINEKRKNMYTMRMNPFLFMATNKPVKITDAKSGLIRRLIDVNPSGRLIPADRYHEVLDGIDFEIGAIANHCLDVYNKKGMHFYDRYRSTEMRYKTDVFYNFVDENYFVFSLQDGITLKQAYALYKEYCNDTSLSYMMPMYMFREELKNYFRHFDSKCTIDGVQYRSYYRDFITERFDAYTEPKTFNSEDIGSAYTPTLNSTVSLFDLECADCFAQYANSEGTPFMKWDDVTTKLKDIDTSKTHYVRLPDNHIVIDFDIKDPNTNKKSAELNLKAASEFPPTYTEFSKSGAGIHLHYIYDGDSTKLSRLYSDGIEVKVFSGNSSLRRKLTLCNDIPINHISGGLPLKEIKVINTTHIKTEKALRDLIIRNLNKEIHPATKPSIDFIYKILDDAYNSGLSYDVSDLEPKILVFATNSTNNARYCIKTVGQMRFKSKDFNDQGDTMTNRMNMPSMDRHIQQYKNDDNSPIVFFDIEVFPNLLLINYKADGPDKPMVRLINPEPKDIELLFNMKLVGYNNRRYDNHIIYGRWLGKSLSDIYKQSKAIVSGTKEEQRNAMYGEAYNISYSDVYDFASSPNKMSLKKAENEMGIHHMELGLDWNKPVPKEEWTKVSEYCDNDVLATEARFHWIKGDWVARQILADLTGMTVNDTTNTLSTRFIFKNNKHPQNEFNYRDLGKPIKRDDLTNDTYTFLKEVRPAMFNVVHPVMDGKDRNVRYEESILPYFPGYKFEWIEKKVAGRTLRIAQSTYRGEIVGEGGYVYSEPGIYMNVALLDITSMHPTSSIDEALFGPRYTRTFKELVDSRIAIKHHDWDKLSTMLDGRLVPYIEKIHNGEITPEELSGAIKTIINSVYGLTSAGFPNAFKDPKNVDNIVAKRGALFMIDLKHAVQEKGFTVAHIKTDSIKIPNATPSIIEFVMEFGEKYGYTFEHEATYDRMCLIDKANYIARYKTGKHAGEWTATGKYFARPYLFKRLFSKEPITFDDMCESRDVKTALYLDMNEGFQPHLYTQEERDADVERISEDAVNKNRQIINNADNPDIKREEIIKDAIEKAIKRKELPSVGDFVDTHNYVFVGKAGLFCPIKPNCGGGELVREQDGKFGKFVSATDSKGYRWLESEMVRTLHMEDDIDESYHIKKVDDAIAEIEKYGDFEHFVSDEMDESIEIP